MMQALDCGLKTVFQLRNTLSPAFKDNPRGIGIIKPRHDLAPKRAAKRALEMSQGFRSGLANTAVAISFRGDSVFALGLDARQLEFLPEDVGEFVEADVDLEDVLPLLRPARTGIVAVAEIATSARRLSCCLITERMVSTVRAIR